ncbi:hypothetical protein EV361DRAFT_806037 [Lentinula raphanica]|uniref:VPS9 domain-containing protein n=1 Tax=Lentinula raphanica TaxID=153919 RepID=A0AA38PBM3_9AGAR|nr:hypothetical protein F5878DRAFT_535100 [Lentinula raphanica]KAJ3968179.1 hypothetical protein EV361DRAFT_806037 [Lentinula raphanica]
MVDKSHSSHNDSGPAPSIERPAGVNLLSPGLEPRTLSRQSSRESLNAIAHPLLSPSSTASALSNTSGSTSTTVASNSTSATSTTWDNGFPPTSLGYVPYTRTARHKPNPSPSVIVTPATTSLSASSVHHLDATTKLQLMHLKAAAQALGLDAGTVGWAILEALEGEHGSEWNTIWDAFSTGKATLLLPSETLVTLKGRRNNTPLITPAFVKNHIIYTELDGMNPGRVVTLSGLRGILNEDQGQSSVTFTSTLHPDTQSFRDITTPGTRTKGFANLVLSVVHSDSNSDYPTYTLPTKTPALSLPPRGSLSIPPPLPPRRGLQSHQTALGQSRPSTPTQDGGKSNSRFAGFASLFGRSSSTTSNAQSSSPAGSRPPSIVLSDTASVNEDIPGAGGANDHATGLDPLTNAHTSISVPAYVISNSIIEQDVLRGIWKGVTGDVERALQSISLKTYPPMLPSVLISFLESANALPVLRISAPHPRPSNNKSKAMTKRLISGSGALREGREGKEATELDPHTGAPASGQGVVSLKEAEDGAMEAIEDLSARWQVIYREVEDLVLEWVQAESKEIEGEKNEENEKEQGQTDQITVEILNQAERILCSVASNIDNATTSESIEIITDGAHDDALASRIAALVMVEFGTRDLDLEIGEGESEETKAKREEQVVTVLRACGNELCTLDKLFTPREKADVMVRAHKVLVDGLTKLPFAISLKDNESKPEAQSESPLEEEQNLEEEELETAVPWKKDDAFPRPEDSDHIDVQVEADAVETITTETQPNVKEPDENKNEENSKTTSEKPSSSLATSFSLDTLFPLLILSVVISNPPRLVSHLLFTQRFLFTHTFQATSPSSSSAAGEQAYCLVNLMAVAEFIGNLDLEAVVSARDSALVPADGLMPVPYSAASHDGSASIRSVLSSSFTLRNRVEQQASVLSSSANKVLTGMSGVMDSSIGGFGGIFKSMNVNLSLPGSLPGGFGFGGEESAGPVTPAMSSAQAAAPWNHPTLPSQSTINARETLDRKESGFSIKSLKLPSMPNMPTIPNLTRSITPGPGDSREKEMVSVSRPASVRSMRSTRSRKSDEDEDEDDMDGDSLQPPSHFDGDESDASEAKPIDTRSIKSFESMMSDGKRRAKVRSANGNAAKQKQAEKKSTTLNAPEIPSSPASQRSSLLFPDPTSTVSKPVHLDIPQSPAGGSVSLVGPQVASPPSFLLGLPPPNERFMNVSSVDDLRLGEVDLLLREYQTLVHAVRHAGGYPIHTTESLDDNPLGGI